MTHLRTYTLSLLVAASTTPLVAHAHDALVGHAHPHAHFVDGAVTAIESLAMLLLGLGAIAAGRCLIARSRR